MKISVENLEQLMKSVPQGVSRHGAGGPVCNASWRLISREC